MTIVLVFVLNRFYRASRAIGRAILRVADYCVDVNQRAGLSRDMSEFVAIFQCILIVWAIVFLIPMIVIVNAS